MSRRKTRIALVALVSGFVFSALSQGTFQNLNFERSTIVSSSPSGYGFDIGTANVPRWTAYHAWGAVNYSNGTTVVYNNQPLDAAGVALEGTDYWTPAIQGNFSIFLLGGTVYSAPYGTNGAGIGQTAQISPTAQSITYWGASGNSLQISFAGQMLLFKAMSADGNHTVYGADISAYAGQTGELLFHAPWATGGGLVDNIQFSDQPIPEPRAVSMFAVGGMIFAWRFVRKQLSGKEVLRPG